MGSNGKLQSETRTIQISIKSREKAMLDSLKKIASGINQHNKGTAAWKQSLIARTTLLALYEMEDEENGNEPDGNA